MWQDGLTRITPPYLRQTPVLSQRTLAILYLGWAPAQVSLATSAPLPWAAQYSGAKLNLDFRFGQSPALGLDVGQGCHLR